MKSLIVDGVWLQRYQLSHRKWDPNLQTDHKHQLSSDKVLEDGSGDAQAAINRRNIIAKIRSLDQADLKDAVQKVKVKWNIQADENSKFFHGLINRRRHQLSIKGIKSKRV